MEKKNQFLLYFFFCMMVFNLAKSISGLLLEKKKLVTQREKKVRCASAGIKVIFVFSLLLFILRIKTMICVIMIFDPVIAVTLADSCDGPCNRCLLPTVSLTDKHCTREKTVTSMADTISREQYCIN